MILNIYKPKGWTSHDVVAKVRKLLGVSKVGHAGTLDPLAEGVLIVLTETDTKRQSEFMALPKEYRAVIGFGGTTASYDLGSELEFSTVCPRLEVIEQVFPKLSQRYIGVIKQRVPAFSAVKREGKPLYKSARRGTVSLEDLPVKEITIHSIKPEKFEEITVGGHVLPAVTCVVSCGSGTYIRSLAHDMGTDVGCGAVLLSLVRTRVGDFLVSDSVKIDELKSLVNE